MAGGEGSRLRPLTGTIPKPMVPIFNLPLIHHILQLLRHHGVTHSIVTLHYFAPRVQEFLETYLSQLSAQRDSPPLPLSKVGQHSVTDMLISSSVEDFPLGTAGSVKRLEEKINGTFLVISGDVLTDLNLTELIDFHRRRNALATIMLIRVPDPQEFGAVVTKRDGRVIRFLEKPTWAEAISDTINTGIYVFEPEIFRFIPKDEPFDFSQDLFPKLLEENRPMYGFLGRGYWCDVGNVEGYRRAIRDVFDGKVRLHSHISLKIGEGCQISPKARIHGKSIIGRNCIIREGAQIREYTVLGDNVHVGEATRIEDSTIWNGAYISRSVGIEGAVVCRNAVIKLRSRIEQDCVVGEGTTLEEGVYVAPGVRIWPEKEIPAGAHLHQNVTTGAGKTPFGSLGITGLPNVEITPEFASRIGSAYGSLFKYGTKIVVSRDTLLASRVIKRALVSGLMSSGVEVTDLRATPLPIVRYSTRTTDAEGGAHVRISPYEPHYLLLEFLDRRGINVPRDLERRLEQNLVRGDYRRPTTSQFGGLSIGAELVGSYRDSLLNFVGDLSSVKERKFRLVVDFSSGPVSQVLPELLEVSGCELFSLNAQPNQEIGREYPLNDKRSISRVARTVKSLKADLGVILDGEGEKLTLATSAGGVISGNSLLYLLFKIFLSGTKGAHATLPVNASSHILKLLERQKCKIRETPADSRSIMSAVGDQEASFGGDTQGGFILGEFSLCFDAMGVLLSLLKRFAESGLTLTEAAAQIPEIHFDYKEIECPRLNFGLLMRLLERETSKKRRSLSEGIKVFEGDYTWVLFKPHREKAVLQIFAEGKDDRSLKSLLTHYTKLVKGVLATIGPPSI